MRETLSYRLLIRFAVFSVAITLAITGILTYLNFTEKIHDIENNFITIEKANIPAIQNSLWVMDMAQLRTQIDGILQIPYMKNAVVESSGRILISSGSSHPSRTMFREFWLYHTYNGTSLEIGRLTVTADLDSVYKDMFGTFFRTLLLSALGIFFVLFIMIFIVRSLLTSRIEILAAHIEKLGSDNLESPLVFPAGRSEKTRDELDKVAETINRMAANLKKAFADLDMELKKRIAAEETIREAEERYRRIIETAYEGIWYLNTEGRTGFVNQRMAEMLGYTVEEMIDRDPEEFMFAEDRSDHKTKIAMRMNGEKEIYERRLRRKDGSEVYTIVSGAPLKNAAGNIIGLFGMLTDITERKRLEKIFKKEQQELALIIDSSPIIIFYKDTEGKFIRVNKAFAEALKLPKEEFAGKTVFDLYSAKVAQNMTDDDMEVFRSGRPKINIIEQYESASGTRWVQTDKIPICDKNGTVRGLIGFAMDITERKKAEKALWERTVQLEGMTTSLEKRVDEEMALRLKNEQMLVQQSKMAAMGEMLGAIAHQWRQPLNALALYIQDIGESHTHGELTKKYLDETIRKSMTQIKHMSRTIDDFRSFFKPDKKTEKFNAVIAVNNALSLFSAQLTAHNIELRITCHTGDAASGSCDDFAACPGKTIMGYKGEFGHVILNLINNARDAIAEKREKGLMTEGEKGRITVDFYNREHKCIITIGDNGTGIPAGIINRIFEPYFTTKTSRKGTGLGLYISKVVIEDHMHGQLSVKSDERGTVFMIELIKVADNA